ncbi:phage late control D family protein [Klebsiella pneumoniae subsp. pneumoniae]|nr:phage late control D family protein [Klebsiella pneumoniae subsp. pneumoniae]
MVLNTDAIDKVKSLLDTGARDFKAYQDELSRIPALNVLMGGKALTVLDDKLISLELTDNRGFNADELTISVDDSQGDIALPPRGAELSVSLGWQGEPLIYKGIYIVDEVSHSGPPDRIDITARSADFRDEFNVKREVSWHDVTVERIVSAIAHRYKLKPIISEQLMNAEIDHADQTQESDMSFLTRMADILGGHRHGKKWVPAVYPARRRGQRERQGAAGVRHHAQQRGSTLFPHCRPRRLYRRTGVLAGSGLRQKRKVTVRKRKKTTEKKPRSSSREGDYIAGEDGNVFVLRTTYSSEIAAQRAAAAKWQQLQRGAAEFNLTLAYGRADLYPEMHGTVTGFKEAIDNQDWIIAKATHTIDDGGFKTQLELEAKIPEWIAESEG